jgi:hypothetical protein
VTPDADLDISVFSHEDVEGDFWVRSWLVSLVLLPSTNFKIFWHDYPRLSLLCYDNLFALGRLDLRWSNQDLLPIEHDRIHLGALRKFQSSFIFDRLNLSTKNITIISSMRIEIMSFTICSLF